MDHVGADSTSAGGDLPFPGQCPACARRDPLSPDHAMRIHFLEDEHGDKVAQDRVGLLDQVLPGALVGLVCL